MAASDIGINELVFKQSARWNSFTNHTVSGTTTNVATGTAGISGVDVSGSQLARVCIIPHSCTINFNIQLEYMDEAAFYRIDQSTRTGINYPWTQEINTAGVSRVYVNVNSFVANGANHRYDIKISKSVSGSTGS